ncbi:hypothetical protein KY348_00675 [Candidatus Woesearchaeota archaeon]|nr:hypothetical protein [Candidatus Woesearchaeota archaeon]
MLRELGKYAKLAVLASLVEPKSLSELGLFWYNENGRFYKQKARQEISQAVNKELLIKNRTKYRANKDKILSLVYNNVKEKELKNLLCQFWCHPFSLQTYLCCKAIKEMFNKNPEKAAEAKLGFILNLPLILHQLQEKDTETYSLFVSSHNLENYTNIININAEKNMAKAFRNLKEKTDWLANLNKMVKNNGYFITQTNHGINIKQIVIKK